MKKKERKYQEELKTKNKLSKMKKIKIKKRFIDGPK